MAQDVFDLQDFLPYLLNQAAEATSMAFQEAYKSRYGMTRAQWRVLANLGKFGAMTASEIGRITHIEKTMISRAVQALEDKGYLGRDSVAGDRRLEGLTLTDAGRAVFADLGAKAVAHDRALRAALGAEDAERLAGLLHRLIGVQA